MYPEPFEDVEEIQIVLPDNLDGLSEIEVQQITNTRKLLEEHRSSLERELGACFSFDKELAAKWYIGPSFTNSKMMALKLPQAEGPQIYLDREASFLVSDGSTAYEVMETYSYLRSLNLFEGGLWQIKDCESIDEAIARVRDEVANSYPSFELRGLNWEEICEKHIPLVQNAKDPIAALQIWLAELKDAHTWVRPVPPLAELPYDLHVENDVGKFYRITKDSLAWQQGVRPGDELLEQDYAQWSARTPASPHSKPFVIGKMILRSPKGLKRKLKVRSLSGKIIEWEEEPVSDRWNPIASWEILASGCGYLRINAWMLGKGLAEEIDEALNAFSSCSGLIVDLRANPGGNLLLAHQFRNRFLTKSTQVGWIQNTLPSGALSEKEPMMGELVCESEQWRKPVVFITDPLAYSASEDAILGLEGQDNVKVIGQRSGGGSGRMRIIRLLAGYRLTISTSLTFDLKGRCIEGHGIPLDLEVPFDIDNCCEDHVLRKAEELL